ncbi:MAG: arabinooligosaccharide transport system permease protein [Petroclostridium sp.]|jgi:multiple sugar transport system permease protein|uniref:carbohydrate ABC transporter permease n=1 Tax=Petroclostridium xylanilyticum TaxID=1792311 RepID=UPI000B97D0AD|nr:carbohydrate ABC transporter permease [Petroclostridium xylanilyticum]MBZ4646804.1 binding-protein-dependent transport system inner rane component [Clostridia bacterium]MDK2810682.1 arabinooligosaccharide transport system permease protein [Petroclostridium sp.]
MELLSKITVSKRKTEQIINIMIIIILSIGAIFMLLPFAWMISTSLKTKAQIFAMPPVWIPDPIVWTKYAEVFQKGEFVKGFFNSATVAFFVLLFGSFTSSLAAFAFAKLRFRHKEKIFLCLLGTIMLPYPIVMIPQYIMFSKVGWIDTLLPIIVPGLFGNVSMIFFLRQNLTSVSDALIEAAKIDGCGFFRMYWQIILPLIKAAIASQIILWFMFIWNDYLGPMIYLSTPEKMTLQVVIATFNAYYAIQSDYALIMAGAVVAMLPTLIIFFAFQKFIIKSIAISGIKG